MLAMHVFSWGARGKDARLKRTPTRICPQEIVQLLKEIPIFKTVEVRVRTRVVHLPR